MTKKKVFSLFFHCYLSKTKPSRWKRAWLQRTEQSTWKHTSKLRQQSLMRGLVNVCMDMLQCTWVCLPFSSTQTVQQCRYSVWSQSIFASIVWHAQGDTKPRLHQSRLYKEPKESTEYFWGLFHWIYIKHTFHFWLHRLVYTYISCSEIPGTERQPCTPSNSHAGIHRGSKAPVALVTPCVFTCWCNANE